MEGNRREDRLGKGLVRQGGTVIPVQKVGGGNFAASILNHRQRACGQQVVRVREKNVFAGGLLQAQVAGGGNALVLLMKNQHPRVLLGKAVAQGAASVRAAVVHQDQFKIRDALAQDAFHAGGQKGFGPVHRHDDTEQRHGCVYLTEQWRRAVSEYRIRYPRPWVYPPIQSCRGKPQRVLCGRFR